MAKYTTETYKERVINKFGNRFDLSQLIYINSYHKVSIICKEHNEKFGVDPITFIRSNSTGNYCPKCKGSNSKLTHEMFMSKIKKYENIYDLSKVIFSTTRNSIELRCLKHDVSFNIAARFLSCNGIETHCPMCKIENNNGLSTYGNIKDSEDAIFYKILMTHKESGMKFIKIGITAKSTKHRYKSYLKNFDIEVLEEIVDDGTTIMKIESDYKKNNKHKRFYLPETIEFNGKTECFLLDDEYQMKAKEVKFIRDNLLEHQNGICPLCNNEVNMPTLDHAHSKYHNGDGYIRGVLCNTCNRFIGLIENHAIRNNISFSELPTVLREIAKYTTKINVGLIHPNEKQQESLVSKKNYNKLKKLYTGKAKFPEYPSSKKLTKPLEKLFKEYEIEPFN